MPLEIERKFLIDKQKLPALNDGTKIIQGYIRTQSRTAVRVRIKGDSAYLTIKGENRGATRSEYEYPIPLPDAEELLATICDGPKIEKIRYTIPVGKHLWEIDEFLGDNKGLILAEVELEDASEHILLPDWTTEEVTDDPQYYNANLAASPYASWKPNT